MTAFDRKMLIVVGPQGSGNHMWAKIFGLHPNVYGWKKLQEKYWEGHHLEPFAEAWVDPKLLKLPDDKLFFVTSCSIPYVYKGGNRVPPILEFCQAVEAHKVSPIVAVTSREKSIVEFQQERVRGKITLNDAYRAIEELASEHYINFLSYESLILWRRRYLEFLMETLKFPIDWQNSKIDEIIKENENAKYVHDIDSHWLDKEVKKACEASVYE